MTDAADDGGEDLESGGAASTDATAAADPVVTATPVVRGRPRWGIFVSIVVSVVVLDQLSKAWLVATVAPGEVLRIIGDYVRLVQSQNSGALFGMFRDQALLFGLVSLGVVALIVAYHAMSGRNLYLSIALGLLLGGAIGNGIDRFRINHVTDWVDIGLGDLRFWTFNVADSAITIAILMLIGLALFPSLAQRLGAAPDA
jgi:signal peptidase II